MNEKDLCSGKLNPKRDVHRKAILHLRRLVESGNKIDPNELYKCYYNYNRPSGKSYAVKSVRSWVGTICNGVGLSLKTKPLGYVVPKNKKQDVLDNIDSLLGEKKKSDIINPINSINMHKTVSQLLAEKEAKLSNFDNQIDEIDKQRAELDVKENLIRSQRSELISNLNDFRQLLS